VALERLAPAKVNLFLHVGPPGEGGYHPISSLMVFADVGDEVALYAAPELEFTVTGPFATALAGEGDNLVTRARDMLLAGGRPTQRFGLRLDKRLPIAAGLGGGSADAAAALRLLADLEGLDPEHPKVRQIARRLGADVAACLIARAVVGRGRGDELSAAPAMPPLDAVLVNPGVPSPTGAVYAAFDALPAGPGTDLPALPPQIATAREAAQIFGAMRNDLEAPAIALEPRIGEALGVLARQPETLLARMSGSGATSFALTATAADAARLAQRVSAAHPDWWVRACRLR